VKIILLLFVSLNINLFAQISDDQRLCMSLKTGSMKGSFGEIKSNIDAQNALDIILDIVGLSKNFVIAPCDGINNVVATAYKGERFILYDKEFINQINRQSNDWSSLFILSHEVGHHINGHSLDLLLYSNNKVDPPTLSKKREQELQADEFAAFILGKLGAELLEIEEIINSVSSSEDNNFSSHPSRISRKNAIKRGYSKSINQ
tara:strand:+ start:3225 stop:3836 length:612 start_codon:yes stop_codon:yes gene_type:complete